MGGGRFSCQAVREQPSPADSPSPPMLKPQVPACVACKRVPLPSSLDAESHSLSCYLKVFTSLFSFQKRRTKPLQEIKS